MKKDKSSTRFSIRLPKKNATAAAGRSEREASEAALQPIDEEEEFFGQTLGGIPKPPRRQGLYYVPGKDIVNGMEQGEGWLLFCVCVADQVLQTLRPCPTSSSARACS